MSDFEMFEKAVNRYFEDYEENPTLTTNTLKNYLITEEAENACTLCTRDCPVRGDDSVTCYFRNDNYWSIL